MLSLRDLLALISAAVLSLMTTRYCYSIWCGATRPHPFTWAVWSVIGLIGLTSNIAAGGGAVAIMLSVVTLLQVVVFILSLLRPAVEVPVHWSTWVVCLSGLVLWFASDEPLFAAVGVVIADGIAAWPTIRNAWRNPHHEPPTIWLIDGCALAIGAMAVETLSWGTLLYPTYLAMGSLSIGLIALLRRRTAETKQRTPISPAR